MGSSGTCSVAPGIPRLFFQRPLRHIVSFGNLKKKPKIEKTAEPQTRSSLWLRVGVVAILAAALAGAIYALKGRESLSIKRPLDSHSALHSGHHTPDSGQRPDAAVRESVSINTTPPPGHAPEGIGWVPGGTFRMGCADCEIPDAEPVHLVTVDWY